MELTERLDGYVRLLTGRGSSISQQLGPGLATSARVVRRLQRRREPRQRVVRLQPRPPCRLFASLHEAVVTEEFCLEAGLRTVDEDGCITFERNSAPSPADLGHPPWRLL